MHVFDGFAVQQVFVERIIDLRHRVLRSDLPIETARFPDDDDEMTLHFAGFASDNGGILGDDAICCASFIFIPLDGEEGFQLRGMATDKMYRGRGFGRQLLLHAEETIRDFAGDMLLWCHARVNAVGFYERCGWHCVSEEFIFAGMEIVHRTMVKRST